MFLHNQEMIRHDHGNVAGETDDTNGLHDEKQVSIDCDSAICCLHTPVYSKVKCSLQLPSMLRDCHRLLVKELSGESHPGWIYI